MTSEGKSAPQTAMLTTDAVPIPSAEVQNAHAEMVPVQNELGENDTRESEEYEDTQEERVPRGDEQEIESVKLIDDVEVSSPQELSQKAKESVETPMTNNLTEKRKKPSSDKRIRKHDNSPTPGQASSVMYSITNVTGPFQIGHKITINMPSKQEKSSKTSPRRIPKAVEDTFKSTETVKEEDLDTVAPHVGSAWRRVGRLLNFSDGELDQFKIDYKTESGMKEVIYQMLLAWKREMSSNATRGILCRTLWSAHEYDAAEKLVPDIN
ncbi:uncharacterized protein LOC126484434 [Schistocerca serialis cubense]|uniref:uncharacterized protein LOC126484434 n=1 Tax=Schistocerca serialis cubense TaxID=2023355 RepID=UPI00214E099C|nr:uncharacterized protein LOC126484434 [Schistocerca serialis cubense]